MLRHNCAQNKVSILMELPSQKIGNKKMNTCRVRLKSEALEEVEIGQVSRR